MPIKKIKGQLVIILIYFGITCLITFPLIFHLPSYVARNDTDSYLMQWNLAQNVHKLSTDPLNLFQANYFYPHKNTLAYSEHHLGSSILAFPIIKISNNPLLALNILIILAYVVSGWGTFLLVTKLTKNKLAGFLAGLIFAFAPFRTIHISQLHVVSTQYLPFIIFFLENIFQNPKFKYYFLFTLFLVFQSITSLHLTFFTLVAIVMFTIVRFLVNRLQIKLKTIAYLFLSIIIVLIINIPLLLPYLNRGDIAGSNLYIANYYSPSIVDYLKVSPILHYVFGYPKTLEKIFYPGILVLILFILSLYWIFNKKSRTDVFTRKKILVYLIILISVFLFSFGPFIRFVSQDEGIVGPYLLLELIIPGMNNLRTPGRFMIVGSLLMAVLIGWGVSQRLDLFKSFRKRKIFIVLTSIFILGEYFFIPPFSPLKLAPKTENESQTAVSQWMSRQPGDFAILEIPLGASNVTTARYMYYSTIHWKKLINGYSGFYPRDYFTLEKSLLKFPSPNSIETIRGYNPKYIVVHYDKMAPPFKQITPSDLEKIKDLQLVYNSQNIYVYELTPRNHD